jgi:crotonobetainyl-CoA:carnitine CoA-transferase CaiB-like acyl-CoA transferase
MSPYKKLVGVLQAPELLAYDDPRLLFEKRDEIWDKIAAKTREWTTADLLDAMLAVDIWCGEIKRHLEVLEDPQVQHMGTSSLRARHGRYGKGGRSGAAAQQDARRD